MLIVLELFALPLPLPHIVISPILGVLVKSPEIDEVASSCKSKVAPSWTFRVKIEPVPFPDPNEINGDVDLPFPVLIIVNLPALSNKFEAALVTFAAKPTPSEIGAKW